MQRFDLPTAELQAETRLTAAQQASISAQRKAVVEAAVKVLDERSSDSTDGRTDGTLWAMSETVMTIEDAAAHLPELVDRVHTHRQAALIVRAGRPVVRIVPVPAEAEVREDLLAFLRRWQREYPDPDEHLAEEIQESRRAVQPPRDPWD